MSLYSKIQQRISARLYKQFGYPVVSEGDPSSSKRALLAYLSLGMKWKSDDARFGWHQNYRQSCQIARLLVERGYRVDVVQYNDERFVPSAAYDLVIAHPGAVSKRLQELPKTGFRLCLRTGRHASFVNRVVADRHALLRERRGGAPVWSGLLETDEVYRGYDAIACFDGNGTTAETFRSTGLPVYGFRNYANPQILPVEKNWNQARTGFVYMAAQLHVLKGLDWLIEAFAERPDLQLYICGKIPAELHRIYAAELNRSNLHLMGFVELNSEKFRKICRRAAWYISPSSTDGCQGTALDAMAAGLVPILSDACGIDPCGAGLRLNPCTPDRLRDVLDCAGKKSAEGTAQQSRQAAAVVEQQYRPNHFLKDWQAILEQVGA